MNRGLLEKPFEAAQIRQRKGRNGVLDYVEGHRVIQRLNDALDGSWSFEVVHHEIREDEVLVVGRLSADGVVKMQFGVSQVTREKESGQPVSLGDDLKAAATDALKKCATFLGVALHLYAEKPIGGRGAAPRGASGERTAPASSPRTAMARPAPPAQPATMVASASLASGPAGTAATPRQLEAIRKVAQAKGLTPEAVESMSLRVFNRRPDVLTQREAAGLIKELSSLKRSAA